MSRNDQDFLDAAAIAYATSGKEPAAAAELALLLLLERREQDTRLVKDLTEAAKASEQATAQKTAEEVAPTCELGSIVFVAGESATYLSLLDKELAPRGLATWRWPGSPEAVVVPLEEREEALRLREAIWEKRDIAHAVDRKAQVEESRKRGQSGWKKQLDRLRKGDL